MVNPDKEQYFTGQYAVRGTYGNNSTIDAGEKNRIASMPADSAANQRDRLRFAGEQSLDYFCREWGLAPQGRVYTDFEGITLEVASTRPSGQRPFPELYGTDPGRISKNRRNLERILRKKIIGDIK